MQDMVEMFQVSSVTEVTDGLHIKVDHKNHGMYFDDNYVTISMQILM